MSELAPAPDLFCDLLLLFEIDVLSLPHLVYRSLERLSHHFLPLLQFLLFLIFQGTMPYVEMVLRVLLVVSIEELLQS